MAIVKGEKRGRPGRWLVDYRDGAGIRRIITCQTLDAAKDVEAEKRQESRQHHAPVVDPNITLDTYAARWLEQVKVTAKVRTWESYTAVYALHIKPALGDRKVRTIHKAHVKALLVGKLGTSARASVKLMFAVLRGLLNAAVDDGVMLANPCAGLGRTLKLSNKPGAGDEEIAAFDREQVSAFLAALPGKYRPVFLFLARTGVRVGEAIGLQWGDLDLTGRTARIARTFSKGRLGTPKGNRPRTVDLSRQLVEVLRHHRAARAEAALRSGQPLAEWVFTTSMGGPLDESRVRKVMARTLKAATLPEHHTPKSLRHTFASIMLAEGESPQWTQQQLGHASLEVTMRVYGRWLPKKPIRGGVDRLDSVPEQAVGSKTVSAAGIEAAHVKFHA